MIETLLQDTESLLKDKAFLTVDEVADLLSCDKKVVHNWTRRKDSKRRPPRLALGKTIRFPKTAFVQWLLKENQIG